MSFNLVLDEPAAGDKVEEHEGLKFTIEPNVYDKFGPFALSTVKHGQQTFLQLKGAKTSDDGGGCSTCSSCG